MRRLLILLVVLLCVSLVGAQTATPLSPTPAELEAVPALMATAQSAVERAEGAAQQAQSAIDGGIDRAFDLLGLFEAIGFFVTVAAGVLGVFGFTQIGGARREIAETNKQLQQQATELVKRFEDEIRVRNAELQELREQLLTYETEQRKRTDQALVANSLLALGERQYRNADYEGTIATYKRAIELDPRNPVLHQRIAYVYTQSGHLQEALYHYQQSVAIEANFAPSLAGLGYVNRRLGDKMPESIERSEMYNSAEKLLLQALKLSPRLVDDDGESWWGVLGGLYRRRGQIDQALDAYKRVTEVTPQSSYGLGNMALLYMKKNERTLMLEAYARVETIAETEIKAKAGNFWGYADLIVARYALGKSAEAEDVLPNAFGLAPYESPFMLEGLRDTLSDLSGVVEQEKRSAIQRAIRHINDELARRADSMTAA